jgi:1,4-dihydroxy-2-naphthoate octaprenyltransferase
MVQLAKDSTTTTPGAATFSSRRAWILAARPKTLPAAISPVLVGCALAYAEGAFALLPAVAALLVALLLQIGANLANDYFDFFKGADTPDRLGPTRVVASGLITPEQMRTGIVLVFGAAALAGLYLAFIGGWPLLAVGAAVIVAAIAYTGGPWPFGYYGLGDIVVFLTFGLAAVVGTYYVQALRVTALALLAAIPPGALITDILVVNNLRDLDTDRRAGKHTLAVLIGANLTRLEYALLMIVAYAIPLGMWVGAGRTIWIMLPWLSAPIAWKLVRALYRAGEGHTYNVLLARTAQLTLLFCVLLAAGFVL